MGESMHVQFAASDSSTGTLTAVLSNVELNATTMSLGAIVVD